MFIPKVFNNTNIDDIQSFVSSYPLATVIAHQFFNNVANMEASHIPLVWVESPEGNDYLLGHITKVNPLNSAGYLDLPWMIIFSDSGHYISPNWYPSKAVTHKEVPTWNYRAVHITGTVKVLNDTGSIVGILRRLTQRFEVTQPMPWTLNDAPDKYIQGLCRAIVGIRIDIEPTNVKAQFKLSQNKTVENRIGVVNGLRKLGSSKAMEMANLITYKQ